MANVSLGCGMFIAFCALPAGQQVDANRQIVAYTVREVGTGRFLSLDLNCEVPAGAGLPPIAAVKREITKQVTPPVVMSGGTRYLYRAGVVFYLRGPTGSSSVVDPAIAPFELGGHRFAVSLHLVRSTWTWGDGPSDTYVASSHDPAGMPYTETRPCESVSVCSAYIAHAWTTTGTHTVGVVAYWQGTYTIDGGRTRIPIPGEISRAGVNRVVEIRTAHSILIAPS
ncbi:hypothetical protein M6D93_05445 [Jatrophihabitans telluris]|uniref:PKD domain-containing protein n=1 Tax=Jatrophihabitans telluris TaxID=2038343 RepID=A0ABY4R0Z9_9ACTN|nr:hypothetical protein [Jatrophihabitans telluris]UQX89450.1 hypothetical protein M6D93_05445 [Jatrophihabitans telluris]